MSLDFVSMKIYLFDENQWHTCDSQVVSKTSSYSILATFFKISFFPFLCSQCFIWILTMLHREMLLIMVEVVTTECFFSSWRQTKNNSVCHIWICYKPGIFYSALRLRRYNKLSLFTFQRILVLYIDSNSTTDVKI